LIGNAVQVIVHELRLRTDAQNIVADTLDQRCLPARRDGAEGVPGVAGDQTELGGFNPEFFLHIGVSLGRRLVVLDAVGTESSFKQIDNAAMFKLAGLNLKQVVGEREEPKTCIAQLAQCRRNLGMAASWKTFP